MLRGLETLTEAKPPEARHRLKRPVRIVSNVCLLRAGQLEHALAAAERELATRGKHFLQPATPMILLERNQQYLDEIAQNVLAELSPTHYAKHFNHLMPHYVVEDGRVNQYTNLDISSPIVEIFARMKHPCSLSEKAGRNTARFGRVSEAKDPYRFMVGDIIGFEIVVKNEDAIEDVADRLLAMPCFHLENEKDRKKENGYSAKHLNLLYANGNPLTRWLEVEVQITTQENHNKSKYDPAQAHDTTYAREKLSKPRTLLGRQLVIVGNSVKVDPLRMEVLETEEFLIVPTIPSKVQEYTLVVPKYH